MAIRDALTSFSTPTAPDNLALGTGTYVANNIIDLGLSGVPSSANGGGARDMAIGDDPMLKLSVVVTTAFTSGGSATLQFELDGAPDNGSGAPGTWSIMLQSQAIPVADLWVGEAFGVDVPRPAPGQALPRFLRLRYIIGTAAMTAGTCVSGIVIDRFDQIVGSASGALSGYPAGITISN
jgi:hypothetical protein